MTDPNTEFDEKLRVTPKGSKPPSKRLAGLAAVAEALSDATPAAPPLPLPQPPVAPPTLQLQQTSAVTLALELERAREELADAAMRIAAKDLEVAALKGELVKVEEIVMISDRNYQHAVNETAEIRGVLKSLAAILVKWDGWHAGEKIEKQDPQQVQS
jgi:hypothetical protein